MKIPLSILALCLFAGPPSPAAVPAYLPPRQDVRPIEVIPATEIPDGPAAREGASAVTRSLNGQWKLSGLVTSTQPFPADIDFDKGYEAPGFDDSKWDSIAVPLNWYRKYPQKQKPYVRGWYRTGFDLAPEELANRRVILKFGVIGYDATLFLNGKRIGSHRGDFTPFEIDATEAAHPGRNLLAIRVLTDQGYEKGRVRNVTHAYGSQWSYDNIKGGIWQDVTLSLEPEIRIVKLLVTPRLAEKSIEVDYTVRNHTGKTVRTAFDAAVTPAVKSDAGQVAGKLSGRNVELKPGLNEGRFTIPLAAPQLWSPDRPYLYFLTLKILDSGKVVSADAVRFGYREFIARDGKFHLNGKPVYLFGQNIESRKFGGYGETTAQMAGAFTKQLKNFRDMGYNIVRTAHMPVPPACLAAADELGMMIYHEWAWCFTTDSIDFKGFEENNLREVREFVETSYNHPSVTMWSLGNELRYGGKPEVARQMNLQVQLVRELDRSGRPVSAFSGAGHGYGDSALETDVLDLHDYSGLSGPWTMRADRFEKTGEWQMKHYGKNGKIPQPRISWENIGFSWGGSPVDKAFKRGSVKHYAEYMAKPYSWGKPNGRGYIGLAPLYRAVAPGFADYAQNLFGHRIFELYRLNPDYAGFAPWCGSASGATIWTQPVYPSLHSSNYLFPHNLFTGEKSSWTLEVMNDSDEPFRELTLELALHESGEKSIPLPSVKIGTLAAHSRFRGNVQLAIPELPSGNRQLRLTLKENGRSVGRNFYDLYLGSRSILTKKIKPARPVHILDTGAPKNVAALETLLKNFGISHTVVKSPAAVKGAALLIVPAESEEPQTINLKGDPALLKFLRDQGGTLLVLEQKNPESKFFGEAQLFETGNNFVDLVSHGHPLFDGLSDTEFDTWNNPDHGYVITRTLTPYTINAVAVNGVHPHPRSAEKFGNAAADGFEGKGRVIHSQLEAVKCAPLDSAAAKYLYNLFAYAAGAPKLWPEALPMNDPVSSDYVTAEAALEPVNLAPYATIPFRDEQEKDGKGGWTDQGANDFRMMPTGRQKAAGVLFDILDPERNNGKSCIGLRGTLAPHYPAAVRGIRIASRKYGRLFFMHTAAWVSGKGPVAVYRIHYADGKTSDFEVRSEQNLGDWYRVFNLPEAKVGITRKGALGYPVCTFVTEWENPRPGVPLTAIDLLTAAEAGTGTEWVVDGKITAPIPVVVAITGDLVSDERAVLTSPAYFVSAAFAGRQYSVVKTSALENGNQAVSVSFPAPQEGQTPCFQLKYRQPAGRNCRYFSCKIRSRDDGILEVVLPEADWRGRYRGEIKVTGDNQWRTYRLVIGESMEKSGPVSLDNLRREVFFYYQSRRLPDMPRPGMKFEVKEIVLE
ncbi:MAG: glycoside hydrolase family 2 [Lentisphaeria bacterium]|nr:glycoside hydrolase family 2 [Lentisphaeria bacterium]